MDEGVPPEQPLHDRDEWDQDDIPLLHVRFLMADDRLKGFWF